MECAICVLESNRTNGQILLTTKLRKKQRSTSAHYANSVITRRTAHEVSWSRDNNKQVSTDASHWTDTDKFSILRGSQNIPLVYEFTYAHA